MNDLVSVSLFGWVTDANLKVIFSSAIIWLLIAVVAFGVDFLIRKSLLIMLNDRLMRSRSKFLHLLAEYQVIITLGLIIDGLVFVFGSFMINSTTPLGIMFARFTLKSATLFNLYVFTFTLNRFIFAIHDYYQLISVREDKLTWHSYIKIISFFTWIGMAILAAAYVFNQPPSTILAGLGAISAITLLIFRDTILGIVASIQANATSMVRVGDYISINKFDLAGTIEEISINSVRVRNDDNTITTMPTYYLTTEAVKNWEFMHYTEARRFRFVILIAPESIAVTNQTLLQRLANSGVISPSLANVSGTLTNLGLFRQYLVNLLNENQNINREASNMVRLLAATITGLPIEITGFTNDTRSSEHESIKSQIIEQMYSAVALFELKHAKLI